MMNRYRLFDCILGSDVELPELPRDETAEPDWLFEKLPPTRGAPPAFPWFRRCVQTDGSPWLAVARTPDGYRLRFWEVADFDVQPARGLIAALPLPGTTAATLRHLLLDHVFPIVCSLGDRLVLHAGGAITPAGAVAFLGETGRGKSTLTASFAQAGFVTLGDDALMISVGDRGPLATPSYPGVRLAPSMLAALCGRTGSRAVAQYTTKRRVDVTAGSVQDPVPLTAVFVLDAPPSAHQEASAARMPAQAALVEVMRHGHYVDGADRRWLEGHFTTAGRLVAALPFFSLVYPRDVARLPALRELIIAETLLARRPAAA